MDAQICKFQPQNLIWIRFTTILQFCCKFHQNLRNIYKKYTCINTFNSLSSWTLLKLMKEILHFPSSCCRHRGKYARWWGKGARRWKGLRIPLKLVWLEIWERNWNSIFQEIFFSGMEVSFPMFDSNNSRNGKKN